MSTIIRMVIEIIISLLHIPIYHEKLSGSSYTKGLDYYVVICFSKFAYIIRLVYQLSPGNNFTTKFLMRNIKIKSKTAFFIKFYVKNRPFVAIASILAFIVSFNSYIFYLFERSTDFINTSSDEHLLNDITNCIWVLLITLLTVGFGDITPQTVFGRLLCLMAGFQGLFFSSLILHSFYEALIPKELDQKLLNLLQSNDMKRNYKKSASKCILRLLIVNKYRIENQNANKACFIRLGKIRYIANYIRLLKNIKSWKKVMLNLVDMSSKFSNTQKDPFDQINKMVRDKLSILEKKIDSLIKHTSTSHHATKTVGFNTVISKTHQSPTKNNISNLVKTNLDKLKDIDNMLNNFNCIDNSNVEKINNLKEEIEKLNKIQISNVNLFNNFYS